MNFVFLASTRQSRRGAPQSLGFPSVDTGTSALQETREFLLGGDFLRYGCTATHGGTLRHPVSSVTVKSEPW